MSTAPYRGNGVADTPEEEVLLIHVAMGVAGAILASAGALWLKGATWLVEHQILVPASAGPLLEIPGTGGAGLDLARIAIAAATVLAVAAIAIGAARRAVSRRRGEDLA